LSKADWVASARANFNPGRRQACLVCGRFDYVAQAHHVVPLGIQLDLGFEYPDHEHVWLCPTHHAVIHILIDGKPDPQMLGRRAAPIWNDHDAEQLEKLLDLVARSRRLA